MRKLASFKFDQLSFQFSTLSATILSGENQVRLHKFPALCTDTDYGEMGIQYVPHHLHFKVSGLLHKGFSEINDKMLGKALHAICVRCVHHLDIFRTNTLINMYSKFGDIKAARYVFDHMSDKNVVSWSTMISAFVRAESYANVVSLFQEMQYREIKPNGFVIASLLTASTRSTDMVYQGFKIHGFVVKNGYLYDVYVSTTLRHFYGANGFDLSARRLFEETNVKNVVSWTSMMVDCSDNLEVINMYQKMRHEGISCNLNTYTTIVISCGYIGDQFLGKQVLGNIIKSGYEANVSVANSLVSMFGKFSSMQNACYVFDCMNDRDTISWNSMISAYAHNWLCEESLRCFSSMRHTHKEIDSTTLSALLSACCFADDLKWGTGIHSLVLKIGLDSNVCMCNTLLTMYCEAGRLKDAKQIFLGMQVRDVISWNSMMAGYVQDGKYLDALKVLVEMLHFGKSINHVSFTSALAACSNPEFIAQGKIVHGHVLVAGMGNNLIVGNALVTMYGKCGIMFEAKQVFRNMPVKDLVTWNALISSYADNEEPDQAFNFFRLMRKIGESANYITMVNLLGACTLPNLLMKHGMPLHAHAVRTGFEADEFVKNSLITMYARCGDLSSSNCIFGELVSKNNVTWNTMIAANARHGQGEEALKLFIEMQRFKVKLDQFSLSAALAACANLAILEEGQQIHSLTLKLGFESYIHVMNATMDMYSKCGSSMNDVLKILPNTNELSKMSWNILISSFARHGRFQEAEETIDEMIRLGVKPDHVTFVSLLSACSHGGLVDKGLEYFELMSKEFGVTAGIEHCVCIIDLLGRSGRLYEAEKFIEEMKVEPNEFVWRSLLASCRIHGDSELGKKAAIRLLESNPRDDSAYVLYSNVCATSGKWNDVYRVRGEMRWNKVTKQQACSWIKLKNGVSSFGIGDRSHPLAAQIYEKLGEIMRKIKEAGYVADTSFALQDIDEEQKEANMWNHSERLALAYGLISSPDGYGLRIFKNLRVCGDCHSVFKFVSSVINREIVLRDPYRFHHFNGGKCSCGDYW